MSELTGFLIYAVIVAIGFYLSHFVQGIRDELRKIREQGEKKR